MIKYLGSKRKLLVPIAAAIATFPAAKSVIDLFSGTSRVGHHLKAGGYQVLSNDHNTYASTLATCYVQADREDWLQEVERLVAEFNKVPGSPGFITETYCENSRYFQPKNGARIDAIRDIIAAKGLEPELEAIMLVSLMEAADRVDSTTGVQMAYLKSWAARSNKDLELRVPAILPRAANGKSHAYQLDAYEAALQLKADVAYVDPPYNQHSYLGNYHIWETLVRWDQPEVYGIAAKRIDVRERKSEYNSKRAFRDAFERLLHSVQAEAMVISFSDEGFISRSEMEALVASLYGGNPRVATLSHNYKRYVGAQIGIHNLQGERVGEVSHLTNKEFLFVVSSPDYPIVEAAPILQPPTLF
jgi:adenine-specific DNA-methyltransferase